MFLVAWVCLFVCLFVREQHYSKNYEWISMKFYEMGLEWYNEELVEFWWRSKSSKMSK